MTCAATKRFFATVQNKLHWALHGQTAAEVIVDRADSTKDHMGAGHLDRRALHCTSSASRPARNLVTIFGLAGPVLLSLADSGMSLKGAGRANAE